ncbi:MAG TPA: heme NO-binding domain-containing protein [Kofleriaceae bacterium]|nr:heme NO-binding domain-containing protein [Kofleriaceae bacterium]
MYGMVNKAIEDLVTRKHGAEAWTKIMSEAGVYGPFVCMRQYPDEVTYKLVGAASQVLGASSSDVLEAFGEFWTTYTASEGYGDMLGLMGDNLVEFLGNLDNLHARVGLAFPELRPPSFECEEISGGAFRLRYRSHRAGLAPLVVGLLRGLGKMFKEQLSVELEHTRTGEGDADVFVVHRGAAR